MLNPTRPLAKFGRGIAPPQARQGQLGVAASEVSVSTASLGRRIRCRLLRWHHWQTYRTEDGGRYKACTVCHKDHPGQLGPHNTIGG